MKLKKKPQNVILGEKKEQNKTNNAKTKTKTKQKQNKFVMTVLSEVGEVNESQCRKLKIF